jgi:hypothetical protein
MVKQEIQESIEIRGHLGPIKALESPLTLNIAPLTVLIGPQGTGKSLMSQLLYFFRDAKYLISTYSHQEGPERSVRKVLDGIRSGESTERAFASFVMNGKVDITYTLETPKDSVDRSIALYENNRTIRATGSLSRDIKKWLTALVEDPSISSGLESEALFIPAERSFFSRLINSNPAGLGDRSLPITMREFSRFLIQAANTHQGWQEQNQEKPHEVNEIDALIAHELRGRAIFSKRGPYARRWQWMPEEGIRPIEIEMASSGQMETWPMVSIAQALFAWEPSQRPLFLHIEEPETHLHPSAQIAITKLLAYLCNKGFRLVITTHSLFVLYVLNNLFLAEKSLPHQEFNDIPNTSQWLSSNQLNAYLFADGTATSIRDSESGELDESKLSYALGELETQYNQIQSYGILWD